MTQYWNLAAALPPSHHGWIDFNCLDWYLACLRKHFILFFLLYVRFKIRFNVPNYSLETWIKQLMFKLLSSDILTYSPIPVLAALPYLLLSPPFNLLAISYFKQQNFSTIMKRPSLKIPPYMTRIFSAQLVFWQVYKDIFLQKIWKQNWCILKYCYVMATDIILG